MAVSTLNIGANPVVRGALKFTGDTDIGPNISMNLPQAAFGPGAAMNLIGDDYVVTERAGEVLIQPDGSSGAVTHPDDTMISPTTLSHLVGMGVLEWQQEGAA